MICLCALFARKNSLVIFILFVCPFLYIKNDKIENDLVSNEKKMLDTQN